jgi:hypothetical protein
MFFITAIITKSKYFGYISCKIQIYGYYTLHVKSSAPALLHLERAMTLFQLAQIPAWQAGLRSLTCGSVHGFSRQQASLMDLTKASINYRPEFNLFEIGMR